MTYQLDVASGRDTVARWCALAEQRLEYLSELFETGRWRRFHSERALLENIEEAKAAVKTWRELSSREAWRDNRAMDRSWLDRTKAAVTQRTPIKNWRDPAQLPWPAKIPAETPEMRSDKPPEILPWKLPDISNVPDSSGLRSVAVPPGEATDDKTTVLARDPRPTIAQRYPLLSNRFWIE
jgi:uncharacterized repeat protein (TIGR03809 family)